MSTGRKTIVVGGGPGGLCAAMLLAARDFEVTLVEKQGTVGGRTGGLSLGPYSFDVGSTMLMMPFILDEMFALAGRSVARELELVPLRPMYRLVFGPRWLDVYSDPSLMEAELKRFAPGSEPGLERFLRKEHARLERLFPVLQKSWPNLGSLIDPAAIAALPHIGVGHSLHDTASEYFDDDALQLGFSFQSAYLGMSPWQCPGGFGMVPYVEHAWGVDYVRGGMQEICRAMERVARADGAEIRVNTTVRRLLVEDNRCVGVELESGERLDCDQVVLDADAAAALLRFLDHDISARFSRERLGHLRESCSTFMLYLGLDVPLPLRHHTFFFAHDYRAEMERLFGPGTLGDDLSLYLCNPVVTDPAVAPEGHSALYVLALVPNTRSGIDWSQEAAPMRRRVLNLIARRTGVDVERHLREEHCITPAQWERDYQISHGAVFGPAHSIDQLLAFRLPNELPSPKGVFLAGGGTNPGSGLPTILESARIATRLVCQNNRVPFPASRPLPEPLTWKPESERPLRAAS